MTHKGTFIVNAFLHSKQTDDTYNWLRDSAKHHNVDLSYRTNADYLVNLHNNTITETINHTCSQLVNGSESSASDFILFWNKDTCLGRALENHGYRLFNPSEAIANCDNKALTTEALLTSGMTTGIRLPKTIKVPMTFDGIGYNNHDFIDYIGDIIGFPFVIKECWGSYGGQVYLAHTKDEAIEIFNKVDGTECIAQEYISSSRGRDLRAYVVGDRVVAAMERRNDNDFRANITNGGSSLAYKITDEQEKMAIAAAKALKLDFAGVDLMFLDNDAPILCEVNSNAQFLGLYEATGINIPDAIFEHILSVV